MPAPAVTINVGKSIPAGYVLGRVNGGTGPATLISIADLSGMVAASGYVMPVGSSSGLPTGTLNYIYKVGSSGATVSTHLFEDGTYVQTDLVFQVVAPTGSSAQYRAVGYGVPAGATGGFYSGAAARGTPGSPTAVQSGDILAAFTCDGYDGADFSSGSESNARIQFEASEAWTATHRGSRVRLHVTANGATLSTEAGTIEQDGGIIVPSTVTGGSKGIGTINAAGLYVNNVAVSLPTSGAGLYAGTMQARPTSSSTGLSTWLNQGTASVIDSPVGVTIKGPQAVGDAIRGRYKTAPATPYSVIALLANNAAAYVNGLTGIAWYDGTNKIHAIDINRDGYEVTKWTSPTVFSTSDINLATGGVHSVVWFRLRDDGTTVYFDMGHDGYGWANVFNVAKASGFLGATGYSNIMFFIDPNGQTMSGSLLSYQETNSAAF